MRQTCRENMEPTQPREYWPGNELHGGLPNPTAYQKSRSCIPGLDNFRNSKHGGHHYNNN